MAQWGWLNNDCQQFRFVSAGDGWSTVTSKLNGRVWQPAACGGVGAAIQAATADGSACQQFRIQPVGNVLIADAAMRRVLSALPFVRMTDRRPYGCQLWHFAPTSGAYYHVVDACTGRDLTVHNGHLTLGGPGPAAEWRIDPTATGTYQLVDRTGTSLDDVRLLAP